MVLQQSISQPRNITIDPSLITILKLTVFVAVYWLPVLEPDTLSINASWSLGTQEYWQERKNILSPIFIRLL